MSHHDEVIEKMLLETLKSVHSKEGEISEENLYDYFTSKSDSDQSTESDKIKEFFNAQKVEFFEGTFDSKKTYITFKIHGERLDVPMNWSFFAKIKNAINKKTPCEIFLHRDLDDTKIHFLDVLSSHFATSHGVVITLIFGQVFMCSLPEKELEFISLLELYTKGRVTQAGMGQTLKAA